MSDEEEFEEIERIVLGLDEPDFDLYDRVACLDMVKAHQLERKRRQFHSMGNLREGGGGTTVTGEMAPTFDDSGAGSEQQSSITAAISPAPTRQSPAAKNTNSVENLLQHSGGVQNNFSEGKELATTTPLGVDTQRAVASSTISKTSPLLRFADKTEEQNIPRQKRGVEEQAALEGIGASGGMVDPKIRHFWSEAVDLSEIRNVEDQTEFRSLRAQLGIDKISAETLSQYHVRGHMDAFDQPAICYPRYRGPSTRNRIPNGLKVIRRVSGGKLTKENYPDESSEKVRFTGMFGLQMVTQFDNRIVLCTNERDALAVYDASNGIPALSLPLGERFDSTVIPYLEDFDLIYIWFPHIHERFAKSYASYLNAARCYIITASLRPVELVRDNRAKEVLHNIQDAVRVRYKGFRSVQDLRDSVRSEIVQSKTKLSGLTMWKRYALLNNYLRGFRPSEITILSGGSYGKTTFMCEYAMDLFTQGIRTLFCNFEMPEEKILKWMIIQFAGPSHVRSLARSRTFTTRTKVPLQQRQDHSAVEMWLDRFERTHSDLIIMKTEEFRDKTLKEIADAIREQTLACGTQHLVIDNLQALVDMATVNIDPMTAAERTHQQDRFVGMLRRMANAQELHITLVVHPVREPNEQGYYELQHIGGPSAKITQEAENVLVIQRRRETDDRRKFRKFLYILKNRFGGRCLEVDQIEMLFQPSTLIHSLVEVSR
uniref:SF4 helicase domain-containing protein n=1 Tax=Meloidogyne enterolobii TaxID=390850 RepID=A0A6V7UI56_MELEN|nr:unnamed protein product [Meloidogyne enterolobii]